MRIRVVGFDPSMNHWGVAVGELDLTTGVLYDLLVHNVEPVKIKAKQVRQNSSDLSVAEQLAAGIIPLAQSAKAVFAEVPVGSQSARGMCAYGMCCGVLGALRATGIQVIEVTATEVKKALHGSANASKDQMIQSAMAAYPLTKFPMHKGKPMLKAEHCADAIGAIHAGVQTPLFQNLLQLLNKE